MRPTAEILEEARARVAADPSLRLEAVMVELQEEAGAGPTDHSAVWRGAMAAARQYAPPTDYNRVGFSLGFIRHTHYTPPAIWAPELLEAVAAAQNLLADQVAAAVDHLQRGLTHYSVQVDEILDYLGRTFPAAEPPERPVPSDRWPAALGDPPAWLAPRPPLSLVDERRARLRDQRRAASRAQGRAHARGRPPKARRR